MQERIRKVHERRAAGQGGFTLIELLVVIVILGILAAVVVFAVGGVGDKGQSSACVIDGRTVRTAEEAYFAQNGGYVNQDASGGPNQGLVPGFLSQAPKYHTVTGASATTFTLNPVAPCTV